MSRIITFYLPWITCVVVVYTIQAYFSHLNNLNKGKYFWQLYAFSIFPIWTIVSMYTKNIVFDGIFYDVLVALTFAIAISVFSGQILKPINWIGIATIIFGLILVKR